MTDLAAARELSAEFVRKATRVDAAALSDKLYTEEQLTQQERRSLLYLLDAVAGGYRYAVDNPSVESRTAMWDTASASYKRYFLTPEPAAVTPS